MTMVSGRSYLEKLLIENASETLAGLKAASIFNVKSCFRSEIDESIALLNDVLNEKGVYVRRIFETPEYTLILAYRNSLLSKALQDCEAKKILFAYGYDDADPETCLKHLSERFEKCGTFPHELGIFLGYPPEDVREYIKNNGSRYLLCGFWKVYCNETEALCTFRKYRICSRIYRRALTVGIPLTLLTVAA